MEESQGESGGESGGATTCEVVRDCLSAGDGISYDPDTGTIAVKPSIQKGNALAIGKDGGVYVPKPTGGEGGGGEVDAPAWPHKCPAEEIGQPVYKAKGGALFVDTPIDTLYTFSSDIVRFKDNPKVPEKGTEIGPATIQVDNPDKCRAARAIIEVQCDVDITLPPEGVAFVQLGGEEVLNLSNGGRKPEPDQHVQLSKNYYNFTVEPGGKLEFECPIGVGGGKAGATYNRLQWYVKVLLLIGTRHNTEVETKDKGGGA